MLYTLSANTSTLIGRAQDADVRISHRRASRRHAKIIVNLEGDAILEDLGSTNGTFINGTQIRAHRLQDGDKLHIGSGTILKFSYQDDLERDFHQSLIDGEIRDALTGIYTRRCAFDQIISACAHARRHGSRLALLIFDVCGFWLMRHTYGDPAGNFVVKRLARIVRRKLRTHDVFARFGAERFLVLARGVDNKAAVILARRIRRAVRSHKFVFQGKRLPVRISLGIGMPANQAATAADLVQSAEGYLRMAKYAGRGCIAGPAVERLGAWGGNDRR